MRGAFALTLPFGYLVSFAGTVSWPEIAVVAPPIAVLVEVTLNVTVWILILAVTIDAADLLVCVTGIGVEAFAARPILTFAVQLLISFLR